MSLSVSQGKSIRLPAEFVLQGKPVDPQDPLVTVLDPNHGVVVENGTPVRDGAGKYHYDLTVDDDAMTGTWRAQWAALLQGERVTGEDEFEVLPQVLEATLSAPKEQAADPEPPTPVAPPAAEEKPSPAEPAAKRSRRSGRMIGLAALLVAVAAAVFFSRQGAPSTIDSLLGDAHTALQSGDYAQARSLYLDVLERSPGNRNAYYNLGIIAQLENRPGESEEYYRRALEADPTFHPAWFNVALLKQQNAQDGEAVLLYQKALEIEPEHAPTYLNLGLIYRKLGQESQAQTYLARAAELDPSLQERAGSPAPARSPSEPEPE